jgi:SAM-dependent methyltransferase
LAFSDLFSRRRKDEPAAGDAGADSALVFPSKGLPKFIASLGNKSGPVLLDLGPVVGSNLTFFGETLGCKIAVEDLAKDLERHARDQKVADLPAFFKTRFTQADASVDGIICWDLIDHLDKAAAPALARELVRILAPDGALLAFFAGKSPVPGAAPTYTKHVIRDQASIEYRPYPATVGRQRMIENREVQRIFEPLRITEQVLLKSHVREVLFRKVAERPA